ncbi:MAG: glycosyltransferase family 39 protein [Candidatus Omnitrophota bacterium]|nr:glycosyltransferase family 39 protein [Candidatus Omnitrophota bacterium]
MIKRVLPVVGFVFACFFLFFFVADLIPLWSSDEGRYAEIAREMFESRNFIVPHFNYVEYLEKPILAPYAASLFVGLLGEADLVLRLPSILSALLGILVTYIFTRRLFSDTTARLASLLLLTSIGYVLVGRFAVIDMQMILLLSTSILFLMSGYFDQRRANYLWAYFFMGLTVLTKGLIGVVLPGLIFFVFLVWTGRLEEIKRVSLGWGIVILLFVVAPWVVAVSWVEPEFLDVFILKHHFERFASGGFGRSRPFWFFSYVAVVVTFPWALLVPSAVLQGLKGEEIERDKTKYLVSWITVIFIFFSIPRGKLPYYIVPICVPVAILVAGLLAAWKADRLHENERKWLHYAMGFIGVVCVLGFFGLNIAVYAVREPEMVMLKTTIFTGSLAVAAGGVLCLWALRKKRKDMTILSLSGMIYTVLLVIFTGMVKLSPLESTYAFASEIAPQLTPETVVAVFASPDRFSDLPFYLKRRIVTVGGDRGTLDQGSIDEDHQGESSEWFLPAHVFGAMFNRKEKQVYCLLEKERLQVMRQRTGVDTYHIVKDEYGKILISNRPSSA